jgi:CubicO group peptidase (beta-lactamase class C family)
MKKPAFYTVLLLTTFLFSGCRQAGVRQNASTVLTPAMDNPELAGFSAERLARLNDLFQQYVDSDYVAGASAIIARKGKIVYYRATGYDERESKTPLERNAIFRVASQTKAITSVAIMMLYEEGKFLLDDPISKYAPEFSGAGVLETFHRKDSSFTVRPAVRPVSFRDLLSHTSGYAYPGNAGEELQAIYLKQKTMSGMGTGGVLREEMQKIATLPLAHQPGQGFTYGFSSDILGYLVEVLSGMNLDEYFREKIFDPLGMDDTYFFLPEKKRERLMCLYRPSHEGLVRVTPSGDFNPDYPAIEGTLFSGGGGLSSTAWDYAIFLQMLLNGGKYNGIRLLSQNTVDMMAINQIGELGAGSLFIPGGPDKFGLGFEIISPPGSRKIPINDGAFGWGGAFGSLYWIDPSEELIAQLVIQKTNDYAEIRGKFIAMVYQALVD